MSSGKNPNCYVTTYHDGSKRLFFPFTNMHGGGAKRKKEELSEDEIKKSIARTRRLIKDLAFENEFEWFGTITNGSDCSDRDFFDKVRKKLSDYKRRSNSEFDYIIVPDRSGENQNKLHFHGFFKGIPKKELSVAISPYTGKTIKYKKLTVYNWNKFIDIGFNDFTRIKDLSKSSSYIAGYATKTKWDLLTDCPRKVLHSSGLKMPERKFIYLDENIWLGHDIQIDPNCYCMSNDFGYFIYIKKS